MILSKGSTTRATTQQTLTRGIRSKRHSRSFATVLCSPKLLTTSRSSLEMPAIEEVWIFNSIFRSLSILCVVDSILGLFLWFNELLFKPTLMMIPIPDSSAYRSAMFARLPPWESFFDQDDPPIGLTTSSFLSSSSQQLSSSSTILSSSEVAQLRMAAYDVLRPETILQGVVQSKRSFGLIVQIDTVRNMTRFLVIACLVSSSLNNQKGGGALY